MPSRRYWVAEACGNELGKVMTKERIEQIVREKAELDLLSFLPGTRFRQERNFPIFTKGCKRHQLTSWEKRGNCTGF